ncbi:AAA family ATPase [Desulfocicer niacini]
MNNSEATLRAPSANRETEQSLISALLIDNSVYSKCIELKPEHFYNHAHQKIYRAMAFLFHRNEPVDLVTVATTLQAFGELEQVGGAAYLSEIADSAPIATNAWAYAKIIMDCAMRRQLQADAARLLDSASNGADVEALLKQLNKIQKTCSAEVLQNKAKFQLKRLSEIEFKKPDWLIKPLFEKDTLAMVFSDPGGGKTFLAIDIACSVATGKNFHGMKVSQGLVIYIAGEGQNGIKRRFMAWGVRHLFDLDEAPIFISLMPGILCEQDQAQWVVDAIKHISEIHGDPALIIIDTVARNFGPGDENSTKDMNSFVQNLDLIRGVNKACVLLVHHTGHGDKSRGRGAMALKGALDAEYRLEKDEQGTIRVEATKMKDSAIPDPMAFKLATVELPFKDEDGEQITSAVLNNTTYEELTPRATASQGKWQAVGIDALRDLYEKQRHTLEQGGFNPDNARVTIDDWRTACHNKGMVRQSWHRIKKSLSQKQRIKLEGEYISFG